ncbi:Threonine aldolase [Actinomortierella ambigua]|nr:Threonine aldolase [Actinomortierella ambigua]
MTVHPSSQFSSVATKHAAQRKFDFRSDTLTQPTDEMFDVMKAASRGDDVYGEDASVRALEAKVARLTGHEAGLFCVSGTMTNQLAFKAACLPPPSSVLCDARSHIFRYEAGGLAAHSQLTVYPVQAQQNGGHHITVEDIERHFIPDDQDVHMAPTRIISLENTRDGTILPLDEIRRIRDFCDAHKHQGIRLHMDAARAWDAAAAAAAAANNGQNDLASLGQALQEITGLCDSASLCLSKGIGAPIGSVLVGSHDFIRKARHFRKQFGGGWRQAGGLAAAADWCLDHVWPKMATETHVLAQRLALGLEQRGRFKITVPVETNMVFIDVRGSGISLAQLSQRLEEEANILIGNRNATSDQTAARLVLHWQITPEAVDAFLDVVERLAREAAPEHSVNDPSKGTTNLEKSVYASR